MNKRIERMNVNPSIQSVITAITTHHQKPITKVSITSTRRGFAVCLIELNSPINIEGSLTFTIADDEVDGTSQFLSEHFQD